MNFSSLQFTPATPFFSPGSLTLSHYGSTGGDVNSFHRHVQSAGVWLGVLFLTVLAACSSLTPRQKGALTGGAIGAGTGILFAGPIGMVVGGTVGAIGGSINAVKKDGAREREQAQKERVAQERQRQIEAQRREILRQREELKRLREQEA